MLNQNTLIVPISTDGKSMTSPDQLNTIRATLTLHGYCVLRGFDTDLAGFTSLIGQLCTQVTFDPARDTHNHAIQRVDAGVGAIGLHIENGNTPNIPELVGFYCHQAPVHSSPTTVCDGVTLLNRLPPELKSMLSTTMSVTRTVPEAIWKRYVMLEHPEYTDVSQITPSLLQQLFASQPGQNGALLEDNSLLYTLDVNLLRTSKLCDRRAFANALLGPSLHHEKPVYRLHNGSALTTTILEHLSDLAEEHTQEINWQQGDVALLDNWRVMHGRRAIQDAENRQLYIGMGNL